MNRPIRIMAVTAALSAGVAAPALADFARIGSVDVGYRTDRDTAWTRFGGGMEGLRLMAGSSDILCRRITVTFGNGDRQNLFQGVLPEGRPVYVDLQGGTRRVNRIDFTCRSDRLRGGRIYVAADLGRFRSEWQRSPEWAGYWSQFFSSGGGGGSDSFDPNYWVSLGSGRFDADRDRESGLTGWGGRSIDRIALRATNGDARCTRIRAHFASGAVADLNASPLFHMDQGRTYQLDLPGGERNLNRLDLTCRALGQGAVTIALFARK
jgi:hypothetical protein